MAAIYVPAYAQTPSQARVVSACGTTGITYTAGAFGPMTVDTNGNLCFNGSGGAATSVNIAQVNGITVLTGAGATGTGSQRVTVAQDTTTIAGSAPGTAGAASTNVLTVQGIASMTPFLVNQGTASLWNTTWAGGTLGAMANYGTSPGAVLVPGVNAFVTNTVSVSGYDSGAITQTATPANSSHAAGVSVGGLFSVAVARTNGGSGILTNIGYKSTGGSTGQLVVRIWQKNPANTTCTDNTAFAGSDTDDAFLIAPPFSLTPAAPASTTGDANTYGAIQGITWDYKNADTSPGTNLYLCAVTVATDTADENKLVRWTLSGPQN